MGRFDARRLFVGAVPAAVGLATAVLLLTGLAHVAGPALLRDHANGLTLALLGMGVPVRWSATGHHLAGTVGLGDYPALLVASAVVGLVAIAVGWFMARCQPAQSCERAVAPAAAWFAGLCAVASLAVSHGRPLMLGDLRVQVGFSIWATLLAGALWAVVGMNAGALLARLAGRVHRTEPRRRWLATAPGVVAVASAVMVIGLSACGGVSSPTVAAAVTPRAGNPSATSPSTSTSITPTTAASAPAVGSSASGAGHTNAARSARAAAANSAAANATSAAQHATAASNAWAPAAPGVYSYDTTGSTSSLLGTKSFPSVTTLTVDAPNGTRQHSVRRLQSSNGDGFVIEQILDYQPLGVAIVQQHMSITQSGNKMENTLNAATAPLAIPVGAAVGSHRELDLTGNKISGHEVFDIVQSGAQSVGGQSVAAILVRQVLTLAGNVTGTIQLDQWWAPSARVPVKEHLSATIKSGLVSVKTTYDATLQQLTPG